MTWIGLVHNPLVRAFFSGVLAAAVVDYHAFLTWKTWHDVATYQWRLAAFRWLQGGVSAVILAAGWSAAVGA